MLLLCLAAGEGGAQDLEGIGERPPVTVDGSVSARGVAYGSGGIARRRTPFSYVLSGALNLNIYDLLLPLSFTVSEQERSLSQPFNQFGASPRYRWATAHLGYRNLSFSPFTLAGYQVLGAGVELTPGDFRLGFIAGRFARAVEEDTARPGATPAYERTGFSGKIGYGSEANHIDLIVLKAKDDSSSLRSAPILSQVRPAENLVVGASGRASFGPASIYGDFAISDYTRDIRSQQIALQGEAETLGDIIPPRASTQLYTALNTGLSLNIGTFALQASYARIDPDYQSMGAYYLANDLQSLTLAPSLSLLENTLYLNGSLLLQEDNIQGKKRATTTRVTPMVAAFYSPSTSFGVHLQLSDMITSQKAGTLPLNDTLRMEYRTPTAIISPRYIIQDSTVTHNFSGSLSYQGLLDGNAISALYSEYTSLGADITYAIALPRSGLGFNGSVTANRLENTGGTYTSNGFALGGTMELEEKRLNLNATAAMSFQDGGTAINATAGGSYRPDMHHTVNLTLSLTASRSSQMVGRAFQEYISVLGYAYTF